VETAWPSAVACAYWARSAVISAWVASMRRRSASTFALRALIWVTSSAWWVCETGALWAVRIAAMATSRPNSSMTTRAAEPGRSGFSPEAARWADTWA
jgi:hypothetical protein